MKALNTKKMIYKEQPPQFSALLEHITFTAITVLMNESWQVFYFKSFKTLVLLPGSSPSHLTLDHRWGTLGPLAVMKH